MSSRVLSNLLIAAGLLLLLGPVAADLLGFGGAGAGSRQTLLMVAGAVVAIAGVLWQGTGEGSLLGRLGSAWHRSAGLSPGQCLWLGAWMGLLTGAVEVVHVLVRLHVFGIVMKHSQHFLWMAPALYGTVLLVVGGLLAVLAVLSGGRLPVRFAAFVLAGVGVFSQLLPYRYELEGGAMVMLLLGLGVLLTRGLAARPRAVVAVARRTTPWLAAVVVLVAAVQVGWPRPVSTSAPPPPANTPNVLLVVLDTVRADHLSCYGYGRPTTPHLDALAREGVLFEQAMSTSPFTLGGHATMFTGHYPGETSIDWLVPLDGKLPTLAEAMTGLGFATGGFIGNLGYCSAEWGLARGFTRYEDYYPQPSVLAGCTILGRWLMTSSGHQFFQQDIRNDADVVTDGFLGWLDQLDGRPFFAFLNYFDAHHIYDAPDPFGTRFGPRTPYVRANLNRRNWKPKAILAVENAYDGCLAFIDHEFQRVIDRLAQRGVLDNTLIVVTADHGELFGEHHLMSHGNSLYRPLLHVPLIVRFPGRVPAAVRVPEVVSLRDLVATILDLAGVGPPQAFPGRSLRGRWTGDDGAVGSPAFSEVRKAVNMPPWLPVCRGDMRSLTQGHLQLIENGGGALELYDLRDPPRRERNRVHTEAGRPVAERMRAEMDAIDDR